MNTEKIGFLESIALISLVIINKIIFNVPKEIMSITGSSSWLNIIYITLITIAVVCFISKILYKFKSFDIIDISAYLGGNSLKIIVGILYILLFFISILLILKDTCEILQLIYFRTSPLIYIALFFIISVAIATRFSIKVLAKTNLIILPLLLLSIFIILASSIKDFVPQLIFPILGYGAKETFFNGLSNLYSYSGIAYIFFINPLINKNEELKKISIISVILSGIFLFLSILCLSLSLSYTFGNSEGFPIYLLARNLEFGRFFQRADAIFIFIWIISTISYASITIYFCVYIFKKITKVTNSIPINYTFSLIVLGLLILPSTFAPFVNSLNNVFKYFSLILIFGISLIILFAANIKLKIINKKKGNL